MEAADVDRGTIRFFFVLTNRPTVRKIIKFRMRMDGA